MRKNVGLIYQRLFMEFVSENNYIYIQFFSQVFQIAYCLPLNKDGTCITSFRDVCKTFVDMASIYMPEYAKRLKVHILLHLVDNMEEFGPTSLFNTERFYYFCKTIYPSCGDYYSTIIQI